MEAPASRGDSETDNTLLHELPDVVLFHIVSELNDIDFGTFTLVCQRSATFRANELFWQKRTRRLLGKELAIQKLATWKETYAKISQRVSLNFTGNKQQVTIPHHALAWDTKSFTICLWLNLRSETSPHDVIFNKAGENWLSGFGMDVVETTTHSYRLQGFVNQWEDFNMGDNPDMVVSGSLSFNVWNHVALTCSKDYFSIYTNGVRDQSKKITAPVEIPTTPLTLGYTSWNDVGFYCLGNLTDVRVWSRALTKNEVCFELQRRQPQSKDLICYLPMIVHDDTAIDCSEYKTHGELVNKCNIVPLGQNWPPAPGARELSEEKASYLNCVKFCSAKIDCNQTVKESTACDYV